MWLPGALMTSPLRSSWSQIVSYVVTGNVGAAAAVSVSLGAAAVVASPAAVRCPLVVVAPVGLVAALLVFCLFLLAFLL